MVKVKRRLILVVHNVRSAHNVGSLLRTADGLGVEKVYLTGYTPYTELAKDERPPHIRRKVSAAINKTALGAEKSVSLEYSPDIRKCLTRLKQKDFFVAALEQTAKAADLADFSPRPNLALVVGSETSGLDKVALNLADAHLQIPMLGTKESFNVSVAAAMALYHLRYLDKSLA